MTPLLLAVQEENYMCVKTLLELGADVNCINPNTEWGALHTAANLENTDLLSLLLDKGADMKVSLKGGCSVLMAW